MKLKLFSFVSTTSLIVFVLYTLPSFSQTMPEDSLTCWDFNLTAGRLAGGPGPDMFNAVKNAGLSGVSKTENHVPFSFLLNRNINKNLSLGINISTSSYHFNYFSFRAVSLSPFVTYNYKHFISLGAGPAFFPLLYKWYDYGAIDENVDFSRYGFVLRSSLQFPRNSMIFARIEIQYNYAGKIDVPFSWMGQHSRIFKNADNINLNYFYYGVGLGLRLYNGPANFRGKFELSGGVGVPDFLNMKIKYGNNLKLGLSVTYRSGDPDTRFNGGPFALEIYYHFFGKSKFIDQPPWYLSGGFGYMDGDTYIYPRIGRSFNFSKRTGINVDLGLMIPLNEELRDGVGLVFPSGSMGFFVRL